MRMVQKRYISNFLATCILSMCSAFGAEDSSNTGDSKKHDPNCPEILVALIHGSIEVTPDPRFVATLKRLNISPETFAEALRREYESTDGKKTDAILRLNERQLRGASVKDLNFPEDVVRELETHEIKTIGDLHQRFLLSPWREANELGAWTNFKRAARSAHAVLIYFIAHSSLVGRPESVQKLSSTEIKAMSISEFARLCSDSEVEKYWLKKDVRNVGSFEASGDHFKFYDSWRNKFSPAEKEILWKTLTMLLRLGERPHGLPFWLPPAELAKMNKSDLLKLPASSLDISGRTMAAILSPIFDYHSDEISPPTKFTEQSSDLDLNLAEVIEKVRHPRFRPRSFGTRGMKEIFEALKRLGLKPD